MFECPASIKEEADLIVNELRHGGRGVGLARVGHHVHERVAGHGEQQLADLEHEEVGRLEKNRRRFSSRSLGE
jgi:hypothetical protein